MRIAIIADQYMRETGVGVYSRHLLRELAWLDQHNHYTLFYPGRVGAAQLRLLAGPNMTVRVLPPRFLLYSLWHMLGWPPAESLLGRHDLIHVLSGSVRVPARGSLLVTIHDLASQRHAYSYPWRRRWFKQWLLADLRQGRQYVLAPSASTRRDVVELGGIAAERVFTIPLGVDRQQFHPPTAAAVAAVRQRYRLPERFWLFVGAISPRKNLEMLLRSFARFAASVAEPVDLVLAGPASESTNDPIYRLWRELAVRERIHFCGYVADEDLAGLYGAALALVYPSRYEGFGLPLIEAMSCGTPVICTTSSSLPEVVGSSALLVPPDDEVGLAAALCLLASDCELRRRLSSSGIARAGEFSWEQAARRTLALYEQIGFAHARGEVLRCQA